MMGWVDLNLPKLLKLKFFKAYFSRPFSSTAKKRVLIILHPSRISYSQVYPFLFYRNQFKARFGAEIRCVTDADYYLGNVKAKGADVVLLQTWFTVTETYLEKLLSEIKQYNSSAKIFFLDSFAPTDLRLAKSLSGAVDGYIKKAILADRKGYLKGTRGDTNLQQYYSQLHGIDAHYVDWQVPSSFLDIINVGPTFFTGPKIINYFANNECLIENVRSIDVHARLGVKGSPWYEMMRSSSLDALNDIQGLKVVTGSGLNHSQFMSELQKSKLCYSPFGYGEICWRDIEAIQCGSVLLKPDMGHLEMCPAIHIPNETYIPIKWDYSDLNEKISYILSNEEKRREIARNAYKLIKDYIVSEKFVDQHSFVFE